MNCSKETFTNYLKFFHISFLSLAILLTNLVTFYPGPTYGAGEDQEKAEVSSTEVPEKPSAKELQRRENREYELSIEALREKIKNPSNPRHPLDQFHLLDQTFNDYKLEEQKSRIRRIKAEDPDGENVEHFVDEKETPAHYYRKNLQIIPTQSEETDSGPSFKNLGTIRQRDYLDSDKLGYGLDIELFNSDKTVTFDIQDKSGNHLYSFNRPVQTVGFWGDLIYYIEVPNEIEGQKKAEHLQIKFINLEVFKTDVGNAPLPVYSFPVSMKGELNSIAIEDGKLVLNDGAPLSMDAFKLLSDFYTVNYNLTVGMLDPATYTHSVNLIKELTYYFQQALKKEGEKFKEKLNMALGNDQILSDILKNSQSTLNAMADFQGDTDKFKTQRTTINDRIMQTNANLANSRKFLTRMRMLIARISVPRPLGGKHILKSLMMISSGAIKSDKNKFNMGAKQFKSHWAYKYMKYGSFATAAAVVGQSLPDSYALNLHQVLDFSETIFGEINNYLQKSNYGLNYFDLVGQAFIKTTTGITHVPEAYLTAERLPKFLIGLSSVIIIPFITFGVPHFLSNGFSAIRSIRVQWPTLKEKNLNILKKLSLAFRQHSQAKRDRYDRITSKSETAISGGSIDLTDEELKELRELIAELKSAAEDTPTNRLKSKVKSTIDKIKMTLIKDYELKKALKSSISEIRGLLENSPYEVAQRLEEIVDEGKIQFDRDQVEILKSQLQKIGAEEGSFKRQFRAIDKVLKKAPLEMATFLEEIVNSEKAKQEIVDSAIGNSTNPARELMSLKKAFKEFFFSYPSLTSTYTVFATTWNYFFISRIFIFKPKTWFMSTIYPNYMRVTLSNPDNVIHAPSIYNGGLKTYLEKWYLMYKANSKTDLLRMKAWEKNIIPIEALVYEYSIKKSVDSLIHQIDSQDRLNRIFNTSSSNKDKGLSSSISALDDPAMEHLTPKEKIYFRAYFNRTFELTMRKTLEDLNKTYAHDKYPAHMEKIEEMSTSELKNLSSLWIVKLKSINKNLVEDKKSKEVMRQTIQNAGDSVLEKNNIHDFAFNIATKLSKVIERLKLNFRHDLFKVINPKNFQLSRFLVAQKLIKNPRAMARAVRSEVASLLVDKPLALLAILAVYAGVDQGIYQPLHDVMNGPDSFLYMSRYLFYNGFVVGSVMGMIGGIWIKLQVDARIQENGNFDKVPTEYYRKKGFWRYYFKSLKNPGNTVWQNQVYNAKITWANIPASFITIAIANFATLGRFELGAFISTYLIIFLTPLMGVFSKIDQNFELASQWFRAQIPKKYRAHKEAQQYISSATQMGRIKISFYLAPLEILIGYVTEMFELMPTDSYGSRSFLRLVFGGYTPTELWALAMRGIGDNLGFIPGVQSFTETCENLVTNNYTDWLKVQPRGL
jgi:hypothetical protein